MLYAYRNNQDFTEEQIKTVEDFFLQNLPPNAQTLTLADFRKVMDLDFSKWRTEGKKVQKRNKWNVRTLTID